MLSKVPQEIRKFVHHCNTLKRILNDTQRSLEDINCTNLFPGGLIISRQFSFRRLSIIFITEDLKELLLSKEIFHSIYKVLDCTPTILIFGQSCHAKALFVNYLLDQQLLPLHKSVWRWVTIQGNPRIIPPT